MKNFKKIALGLFVGTLAMSFSAFTNNKNVKVAGLYYYTEPIQQTWSTSGALPADQLSGHYSTYPGSPNCQASSNICTYDLVGGKYVQSTQGTFN